MTNVVCVILLVSCATELEWLHLQKQFDSQTQCIVMSAFMITEIHHLNATVVTHQQLSSKVCKLHLPFEIFAV